MALSCIPSVSFSSPRDTRRSEAWRHCSTMLANGFSCSRSVRTACSRESAWKWGRLRMCFAPLLKKR